MVRVNKEVKLMPQNKNNNIKNILEQQKTLADQMRRHQQQAAQDAYAQGQRSLSHQLRQQRRTMQENRENLAQQSHLAQRNIQQGATSRGLGSSGLRNLASLQAQTAQGDALRRLAGDDAQIQREALDTRVALSEQLAQQMSGSEINYLQALLETDRFGLEREDMDRDTLLQLIEMTQADGADPALLAQMAEIAFGDISQFRNMITDSGVAPDGETASTGSWEDLFGGLMGSDEYGDTRLGKTMPTQANELFGLFDPYRYLEWGGSALADLFKSPANRTNMSFSESRGLGGVGDIVYDIAGKERKHTYMIDGERVQLTGDEVLQMANDWHGNKNLVKNGTIQIKLVNGSVKYTYKGRNYGTYNAAKNAYDNATGNK